MDAGQIHPTEETQARPPASTRAGGGTTVSVPVAAPRRGMFTNRIVPWLQRFGALAALMLLVAIASVLSPNFLTEENIRLQLQTFCLATALIGVGQTLVILTGGIDLSVGALLAVGSCLAGELIIQGAPIPVAFAVPIALTTVLGACSGAIIA